MALNASIPGHLTRLRKLRHHFVTAVSSLSTAVIVVAALALLSGGLGIAGAATGRAFTLGRSNSETSTATLSDSHGTPLTLSAPKNKAPLAVNRNVMELQRPVPRRGQREQLESAGKESFFKGGSISGTVGWTKVATTGQLVAGTYYVTGTASIAVGSADHRESSDLSASSNSTRQAD